MYKYFNDILVVPTTKISKAGIASDAYIRRLIADGNIIKERRGGRGRSALIQWNSIPTKIKEQYKYVYGDPHKSISVLSNLIQHNKEASQFFDSFQLMDGRPLPDDKQRQYRANVNVLDGINALIAMRRGMRKKLSGGLTGIWNSISEDVNNLDRLDWPHTLPSNTRSLKRKLKDYNDRGPIAIVHKGYCNDNSRKVDDQLEHLILSLYCMPEKPYITTVHELYHDFAKGKITEIYDVVTGELLEPKNFLTDGVVTTISEGTIWNYITNPKNTALLAKHNRSSLEFSGSYRPHHNRHKPIYALSKVSMDDRDLPRKMHNGKRVKVYYAYDVTSGCVIGASYSLKKDTDLFLECMRAMFRTLRRNNLGIPMEVEVEHHLVNTFRDGMMKAGNLFPFVRFCNPGNSQEKHAEHFNKAKKYGFEKKYQEGIGRWYLKHHRNRPKVDKVWDEDGMKRREKTYSYEELVADDKATIEAYNNSLHRAQKTHRGMTKWEVFLHKQNPDTKEIQEYKIARYLGSMTKTTVLRSQYVKVQHEKYRLPSSHILGRLKPNNYKVLAYYLPENDGDIPSVYIFQDGVFLCKCDKILTYNTSTAEATEKDKEIYREQAKYVKEFDTMIKDGRKKISKVAILPKAQTEEEEMTVSGYPEPLDITPDSEMEGEWKINPDYEDPEYWRKRAQDEL